jgi:apolipoprotein N-acyltransferase
MFGFAWLCLGNAGIDMPLPMRLAPVTGVYGLSFIFMLLSAGAAVVILRRARKELLWLISTLALFLLPNLPEPIKGDQTAVLVQGNVSEDQEWTPLAAEQMRESLVALSLEQSLGAHHVGARLIVWPETPGPLYYYRDPALRNSVSELARLTGAWLLFGAVAETKSGSPLNSAVLLNPAGELVDRYDKVNLVPFGEYVPKVFDFVNRITKEAGDFTPGSRLVVFPMDGHKLATFICYESVFPSEVRQFARQGAELLVNISNDGYFGTSAARLQHLEIARMRAAENRRWLLRATNDGVTVNIDPAGRIREQLPSFQRAAGRFDFAFEPSVTSYTEHGDWFAWSCLGLAMLALFCSQWPHYTPRKR